MTRAALPYMTEFMKHRSAENTKLLDVASGTGQFLTSVRDNFPELQCTALVGRGKLIPGFRVLRFYGDGVLGFRGPEPHHPGLTAVDPALGFNAWTSNTMCDFQTLLSAVTCGLT